MDPSFGIRVCCCFRVIMSNTNSLPIPEFNGRDYDYWCVKMMMFFIGKDLWDIVEMAYTEPEDWTTLTANDRVAKKESRRKNAQALFHIHIALDRILLPRIAGANTTTDAGRLYKNLAKAMIKSKLSSYKH
jgi:hypothetical protein